MIDEAYVMPSIDCKSVGGWAMHARMLTPSYTFKHSRTATCQWPRWTRRYHIGCARPSHQRPSPSAICLDPRAARRRGGAGGYVQEGPRHRIWFDGINLKYHAMSSIHLCGSHNSRLQAPPHLNRRQQRRGQRSHHRAQPICCRRGRRWDARLPASAAPAGAGDGGRGRFGGRRAG